jgi:DNA-binding transcriptional regulator YiaG
VALSGKASRSLTSAGKTRIQEGQVCSRDHHQHVSRTLIGVRLRQLRERSDVPIPTAARRLGVPQATVLRMEFGDPKIRCRPTMVAELSRIYGAENDVARSLAETAELVQAGSRFDPYSGVLPLGLERCVDVEPCATAIRAYGPDLLPSCFRPASTPGGSAGSAVRCGRESVFSGLASTA